MQLLRSLSRLLSPSSTHPALPLQPSHVATLAQVFEAGALGQAPPTGSTGGTGGTGGGTGASDGGNLSTYKELCSLATDLGQPDLIYKFMDLAHHNQVWGGGTAQLGPREEPADTSHTATFPHFHTCRRSTLGAGLRLALPASHVWRAASSPLTSPHSSPSCTATSTTPTRGCR